MTSDLNTKYAKEKLRMPKSMLRASAGVFVLLTSILVLSSIVLATIGYLMRQQFFGCCRTEYSSQTRIVNTDCGLVQGRQESISGTIVFKGIPYAVPPVGKLRWKPPVGLKRGNRCWEGVLKAEKTASPCPQFQSNNTVIGSEDCLYLNVLTPTVKKDARLPVLVWIHGGSLMTGSGTDISVPAYYPNPQFVKDMGVVAVSINYRLNAFGFMALDVLSEASPTKTSGNYGFMDQILVLKWIQENIENFGGDKARVTLLGQSSGGTSIYGLLASESAQGLFKNVISMSGSPVFNKTTKDASKDNLIFVKNSNCVRSTSEETLKCLYDLSISEVLNAIPWKVFPYWGMDDLTGLPVYHHFDGAVAVVDGDVVQFPPGELALHTFNRTDKINVVIAHTAQEIGLEARNNFSNVSYEKFVSFAVKRLSKFIGYKDAMRGVDMYCNMRQPRGSRAEYIYETLASDIRAICPSNVLAANFSKSSRHTVYHYIATAIPSQILHLFNHTQVYAFHAMDALALFGYYQLPGGFIPQPSDLSFVNILRRELGHIMYHGHPESENWTPYPESTAVISNVKLDLSPPDGYHGPQCRFWMNRGFFAYGWIN